MMEIPAGLTESAFFKLLGCRLHSLETGVAQVALALEPGHEHVGLRPIGCRTPLEALACAAPESSETFSWPVFFKDSAMMFFTVSVLTSLRELYRLPLRSPE